jgi:purine-binding chemotaxis protein CheW
MDLSGRAEALRREFDDGFARPIRAGDGQGIELLAIRVAGDPHALRLSEIAGLFADRPVTPVPGPMAELRGLANLRGELVPVYDLRLLLGRPAADAPRWIALAAARRVGLAFDDVDGHVVAAPTDLATEAGVPGPARQVVRMARGTGLVLLAIPALLDDLASRARRAGATKER